MCDDGHNGCCHQGDGLDDTNSVAYSLFEKINMLNVECLNEKVDGSGLKVFKPWSERLCVHNYVESDCDAELLYNIPFTGDVKLKGIVVIADEELGRVRLFKSKMRMSFDDVAGESDQEFQVVRDTRGIIEYPIKPTKFSNVHHLTIHFVNKNREDEENPCRIYYVGLKGEFTQANRDGIVIANYEIRPTEGIAKELVENTREVQ